MALFRRRTPLSWAQRIQRWLWPQSGPRRALYYYYQRLLRLPGSAHGLAAGVASGVAASFSPIGLHIAVALILATLVRGNLIGALLSTVLIGNPLVVGLLMAADIAVGRTVMGSGGPARDVAANLHWTDLLRSPIALVDRIGVPFLIGMVLLGTLAWCATYFTLRPPIERRLARRGRRNRPPFDTPQAPDER